MKAVILAAGRGSRMGSLTSDSPKCLTKIKGESLLSRQLNSLRNAGVGEIAIVRGYKAEKIAPTGVELLINSRWASTNMVSSLLAARAWIDDSDFIVAYSDILYTPKVIAKLAESNADIVVASNKNWLSDWQKRFSNPLDDLESFKIGPFNALMEIGRKPNSIAEIEGQFMGLVKFSGDGWSAFLKHIQRLTLYEIDRLDMTKSLNSYIISGGLIKVLDVDDSWFEFDSESDIDAYGGKGFD